MDFMSQSTYHPTVFPSMLGLEQGQVLRSRVPMTSAIYFFLLKMSFPLDLPLDLPLSVPDMAEG